MRFEIAAAKKNVSFISYDNMVSTFSVQVAFVAIGATMVGSITFLKKTGDHVKKGEEVDHLLYVF